MERDIVSKKLEEALEIVKKAWEANPPVQIYGSSDEMGKLVKGYLIGKVFDKLTETK